MKSLWHALNSSIGSKIVISLTGLAMLLFLVGHVAGNLLIFVGDDTFNAYAHTLISNPLLIPIEAGLALIFLVHIGKTIQVTRRGRTARPIGYDVKRGAGPPSRKTVASSTMIFSGLFIAAFVPFHIKTFKFGPHYESAETGVRDLSRLVVELFQQPAWVGFYVVAMLILGFHLRHGFASAFQSLGADHPGLTPRLLLLGRVVAALLAGGFAVIPIGLYLLGRAG